MIAFIVSILTNPAVLGVLGTLAAGLLDALSAALMGTRPLIARALHGLADMARAKAGRPPIAPLLLALTLLPLFAADATACGPFARLRARRAALAAPCRQPAPAQPGACFNCTTCPPGGCACFGAGYYCPQNCPPAAVPFGVPVYRNPLYQPPPCPVCPGGACPVPPTTTLWQSGPGVLGTRPQTFGPVVLPVK